MVFRVFLDRKADFGYLNGYWKSLWIAQVPTSIIENRNPSTLTNGLFQLLDDKSCYDFLKKTTTTLMKKVMSSKNLWNAFTAFFVSLNARNNCYTFVFYVESYILQCRKQIEICGVWSCELGLKFKYLSVSFN